MIAFLRYLTPIFLLFLVGFSVIGVATAIDQGIPLTAAAVTRLAIRMLLAATGVTFFAGGFSWWMENLAKKHKPKP